MSFRLTRAVCGIDASRTASAAWSVPGTAASTRERGCSSGNLLERGRHVRRRERPGAVEPRRREPAPGHQEVDRSGLAHPEDVALGVADPQKVVGARHQLVVRRPLQQDQLGGDGAHEDRRRLAPSFLPGTLAFTSFQFSSAGSFLKLSGNVPAASHGPFRSAALSHAFSLQQVVRLRRLVLEEVPVRVDRELQVVVLDRAPDRDRRRCSRGWPASG